MFKMDLDIVLLKIILIVLPYTRPPQNLNFLSKAALDAPRFACYTKDAQDIECIKAILYFGITFIPKSPLIHRKIVNALHHSLFIPTARAKALEARIGQFPKSSSLQLGSKCS